MWQEKDKPRVVRLTHALAKTFAEMPGCREDRDKGADRTAFLRKVIAAGEFRSCEWATAECAEDGVTYRVNGKHTSQIFAQMNGDLPAVNVFLSSYKADDKEDVAKLYATFDTAEAARTNSDINKVYAAAVPELQGMRTKTISVAVTGMAYATWEKGCFRQPRTLRAEMLWTHTAFVTWLEVMFTGKKEDVDRIHRGPVVAAMFKTWLKAKQAATDFWTLVRDESGPNVSSPDRTLGKYLSRRSIGSGRGASGAHAVDPREMFVKSIHGWNAWRDGTTTDLKYYPGGKTPPVK